ncbi:hypothetical protein EFK09_04305 [Escherichia coli]|nr:hypothetical protein [Escherichia coli]
MFAGKKSAQIREILINESAWEEMTCLFAPSLNLLLALHCQSDKRLYGVTRCCPKSNLLDLFIW